ncbi:MFS general substrate transporter [Violaceomyces palustris]|uniref:MFS general substrate transporter n=1 Tax=Violaceomyces palustris TaxID=1673888 RepID=A0ACD0NX39_9BASI|nr:MFS general substrate transporter [Violaceomyces palustris]
MSYDHRQGNSPDSASLQEKRDDTKLEDGVVIGPVLTAGTEFNREEGPLTQPDDRETRRIISKMDWRVLPICSVLYLFSFLDRTAIGNAKVAGMYDDLKLNDGQYATALSIFFVLYCFAEIPSNLVLKKLGAKIWLPIIVVFWGLVMLFTGLVKNFEGLVAMRLLLGLFEAGLFPGISYYLTILYPRAFIQLRIGIFFSAATIAGAFGGLLAYGLSHVKTADYKGWCFIFIIEGILTVVVGVVSYFLLFSGIESATFLTAEEKQYMTDRVKYDGNEIAMNDEFAWKFVWAGLRDWKTIFILITYISCLTPLYSIALTLPSILKTSLKYNAVDAQLYSVPVYVVAAVTVIAFAWASDRLQCRTAFICLGSAISAIGWGISYSMTKSHPKIGYGAQFISAAGSYAAFPGIVAALTQNVGGKTKRSVCIAIIVGVGGLSGIVSSNIFMKRTAPYYHTAHYINIGMNLLCFTSALCFAGLLKMANARKQRRIDSGEAARMSAQEIADLGDESPYFFYRY